ncbi:MAG: DoxX family protein [Acidobacteria bacterium]|nr:DoxX family protein [Acidobacteriota bacterium]
MMKYKIGYWVVIGLFSLMMAGSALGYLSGSAQMVEAFRHLGYPDYFRMMLGVAKLLGVVALLLPWTPAVLREWAYAGFVFTLVAAAISHGASGDPVGRMIAPLVALALLAIARQLWNRAERN